jgi:general secretion pathway protein G
MKKQSNPNDTTPPVVRPKKTRRVAVIVVLCLAIVLAVAVLPSLSSRGPTARVKAATLQIASFGTALGAFKTDNGYFPRGANGLICLMQKPSGATNWQGPYMEHSAPTDPWGHAYIYECPGRHNPQTYDLSSISPDGQEICNWKQK